LFFIAGIIEVLDYSACAIAGIIVTFILIEFGTASAVGVYAVSSLISLLLVPSKLAPLLFIAFCGWYSFLKRYLERISGWSCILLKLLVFNVALTAVWLVTKAMLLIEIEVYLAIPIILIANAVFFIYDNLLTRLIWLYVHKIRKKLTFLK
jgi:hypothetical protein